MSELPQPEVGEGASAPRAPRRARAARAPALLDAVCRALRFGLREDGERLWASPWLGRSCASLLTTALAEAPEGLALERLAEVRDTLAQADDLPYLLRVGPMRDALVAVQEAALTLANDTALLPTAELIVLAGEPQDEARAARPEGARVEGAREPREQGGKDHGGKERGEERSRGDERGRGPKGGKESKQAKEPEAPPPAPPPPPRASLGDPEHTGQPVSALSPLRPEVVEALDEAGIETIADLLCRVPADQQKLSLLRAEDPLPDGGEDLALVGRISARCARMRPGSRVEEMILTQGERVVRCRWYTSTPPDLAATPTGQEVAVAGRLEVTDDGAVLYEAMRWLADARGFLRRPIYGVEGVDEDELRRLARLALLKYGELCLDPLPVRIVQDARVSSLDDAIRELHLPTIGLKRARARWVFEEFFVHHLSASSQQPVRLRGVAHPISHDLTGRLQLLNSFALNDGQEAAFDDIRRDLRRSTAMTRLLQGDVGSGKALVALISAVMVGAARSQVLFLAPDSLAAEHRHLFAEPLLRGVGLVPQLISQTPSNNQLDAIRRGEVNVVFATHSFASAGLPEFKKLGLVVVEERSSFGQVRREWLNQKGVHPDLLIVTAVPIPTSLTFTLFSDCDISVIPTESQQLVETVVRGPEERAVAYARMCELLADGRQGYVVFPLGKGGDLMPLDRARQLVEALGAEAFPGYRVGLYHGAMSREERQRAYDDFQRRRFDVLVATTAIEDAPEVANASCVLVESADRFDLVRLHRLRGHVAKGANPGLCFFVLSATPNPEGVRLVELVAREQDGFAISEQDRIARGDEELLGARAQELPSFEIGEPGRDRDLFLRARRAAIALLQVDPQLKQRAHRELQARVFGGGNAEEGAVGTAAGAASGAKGKRRRRRRRGGR
ncbi:hypothetical protein L6R49_03315 [Myxococcota bacterium]|nr:hypothetical protein [Myxococcota bacterium]